ncbi:unnamed protein product [Amoebophrya sp. A120]|nr:unnamed protein product [Amoebophrya sp. A120]|eukprot:GSA120T00020152001.1
MPSQNPALAQAEELQQDALDNALQTMLTSSNIARRISQHLDAELSTSEKMFRCLDADTNGYLGRNELRLFAATTGFEEEEQTWDEAYEQLCSSFDCSPELGLDLENFNRLCEQYLEEECYRESIDQFVHANYPGVGGTYHGRRGKEITKNKSRQSSRHSSRWSQTSRRSRRAYEETPDGDCDWRSRRNSISSVQGRESVCSVGSHHNIDFSGLNTQNTSKSRRNSVFSNYSQADGRRSSVYSNASRRTSVYSQTGERKKKSRTNSAYNDCQTPVSRKSTGNRSEPHTGEGQKEKEKKTHKPMDKRFLDDKAEDKHLRKLKREMRNILLLEEKEKSGEAKLDALQKAKVARKEQLAGRIAKLQGEFDARKSVRRSIISSSRRVSKAFASPGRIDQDSISNRGGGRKSRRPSFYNGNADAFNPNAQEFVPPTVSKEELLVMQFQEAEQQYFYMLQEANQRLLSAWRVGGGPAVQSLQHFSLDNPYAYANQCNKFVDPNHMINTKPVEASAPSSGAIANNASAPAESSKEAVGSTDVPAAKEGKKSEANNADDDTREANGVPPNKSAAERETAKSSAITLNKDAAPFQMPPTAACGSSTAAYMTPAPRASSMSMAATYYGNFCGVQNPFLENAFTMSHAESNTATHPCWAALPRNSGVARNSSASCSSATGQQQMMMYQNGQQQQQVYNGGEQQLQSGKRTKGASAKKGQGKQQEEPRRSSGFWAEHARNSVKNNREQGAPAAPKEGTKKGQGKKKNNQQPEQPASATSDQAAAAPKKKNNKKKSQKKDEPAKAAAPAAAAKAQKNDEKATTKVTKDVEQSDKKVETAAGSTATEKK